MNLIEEYDLKDNLDISLLQLEYNSNSFKDDDLLNLCAEIENIIPKEDSFFIYQLNTNNYLIFYQIKFGNLQEVKN